MTKIAHIVHWPKTGITRLLENIFADIDGKVELHLFFLDASEDEVGEFRGIAQSVHVGGRGGNPIAKLSKFISFLRTVRPDIIHTHSFTPSFLVSQFFFNVTHVRTVHSAYPYFSGKSLRDRVKRFFEFKFLDRVNASVVFVADGVRDALPYRFSRASLSTIQNGVNCASIIRRANRGEPRVAGEKLIICSAGRLEHQKGYDLLISACELLPDDVKSRIKLMIAGEGSQKAALQRQIDEARLGDVITLLGYRDNPYPFIASSDICIFSSRYEGFSIAAAEAMTLGCPVITTRVTGIPELLTHGVDALITDAISPQSLCDAMLTLINDAGLRARIGINGKALAEECFSIETTSKNYLALYSRLNND